MQSSVKLPADSVSAQTSRICTPGEPIRRLVAEINTRRQCSQQIISQDAMESLCAASLFILEFLGCSSSEATCGVCLILPHLGANRCLIPTVTMTRLISPDVVECKASELRLPLHDAPITAHLLCVRNTPSPTTLEGTNHRTEEPAWSMLT
ncbi:hypothetical protein BDV12DRAFT_54812 [Aspergillus spectabilis]